MLQYLQLDASHVCEMLYVIAMQRSAAAQRTRHATRERNLALGQLQARPDVAHAVFSSRHADHSTCGASLSQLYSLLPETLHAIAVRGFFGFSMNYWSLSATNDADAHIAERTAALLRLQPHVTDVRLRIDYAMVHAQAQQLFRQLAAATQLTTLTVSMAHDRWAFHQLRDDACQSHPLRSLALTSLRVLHLHHDWFKHSWQGDIAAALCVLTGLAALSIRARRHDDGSHKPCPGFVTAIANLVVLDHLELEHVHLQQRSVDDLARMLADNSRLRSLRLARMPILQYAGADHLLGKIAACITLTRLALPDTRFKDGSPALDRLCTISLHLRNLDLSDNCLLGPEGQKRIVCAPFAPHLTALRLHNCGSDYRVSVNPAIASPWVQLTRLTNLSVLRLGLTVYHEADILLLAQHIYALTQLQELDLSWIELLDDAILSEALMSAVFTLPQLKVLAYETTLWGCFGEDRIGLPIAVPGELRARGLQVVTFETFPREPDMGYGDWFEQLLVDKRASSLVSGWRS